MNRFGWREVLALILFGLVFCAGLVWLQRHTGFPAM